MAQFGAGQPVTSSWSGSGGPGDRFVASEGYRRIKSVDARPQQWSSGLVEVSSAPYQTKGTLLEGGAGGPGGGLTPPYYQPGVSSKLFEPLGVSDLFGSSTTTASQVRYINEGTALSGAAGVPEAGLKPESTLSYAEVVEPVKKIATLLGISDEMLEDAPSIQSYLNERLGLFVRIEEERQLLRGNGTNELVGLFNRAGGQAINQYTKLAADDYGPALNPIAPLRLASTPCINSAIERSGSCAVCGVESGSPTAWTSWWGPPSHPRRGQIGDRSSSRSETTIPAFTRFVSTRT